MAYIASAFALVQLLDIVAQCSGWLKGVRSDMTIVLVVAFVVALVREPASI